MKKSEVIDTQVGDVHVKDTQIADVNIGTYGSEDYVLSTGQKIRAELITNNTLRIFDGVMVYCGVRDAVAVDDYHDVTIENGSQGMNRNDIAVRYFKKDATTGYGAAEFKAIKGTPTSGTATDPEITVTDLRSGDIDHSMKLYRVRLEGLNIVAVEPLFNVLMPMSEQQAMLAELNRKTDDIPVMLSGKMNLYYKSSSQMTGSTSVDSKFNGCKVLVSVQSVEGTPYTGSYTWNVTGIVSGGKLTIDAFGSGFVSGHVLSVSYLLVI